MKHTGKYLIWMMVLLMTKVSFGQECPIIPLPNHYEKAEGNFQLNSHTAILVKDSIFDEEAHYLKSGILKHTDIAVVGSKPSTTTIVFQQAENKDLQKKGAYRLEMSKNKIVISASHKTGAFYGAVSLLQLMAKKEGKNNMLSLKCWNIDDCPRFPWRGFMLDESRHFFGKKVVEEILDQMAWLKLNKFHWHLTDQQGWRLQIKKYPLLSLVGGIGNNSNPLAPAKFYTQKDIREIVAYAKKRHIQVIPEIDMPGHATAANRAYPGFSGGGTGEYADFTFNPGKDSTYQYLTHILEEVSVLFPSHKIHIGGDEVSYGIKSWGKDEGVKTLMQHHDLKSLKDVEHYFLRRMEDSASHLFNKILAWDEAVDAGLSTENTIILWWRHNKPQQLRKALDSGYQVILCPRIPLYLDFVQNKNHIQGRKWGGKFSSVKGIYEFSGAQYIGMSKEDKEKILGYQGNLWTEKVKTKRRLEFMIFPRLTALSEATWTQPKGKNYEDFLSRLKAQLKLYKKENIYYYNPIRPEMTPEVVDSDLPLNIK